MNCEDKMKVYTDVLDMLPDGTITKLILRTDAMSVTIRRNEPDQNFVIERIDDVDHGHVADALETLSEHLRRYCIYNLDVDCIDGNKVTLKE